MIYEGVRPPGFLADRASFGILPQRDSRIALIKINKSRAVKQIPRLTGHQIDGAGAKMSALEHPQQHVIHVDGQVLVQWSAINVFPAGHHHPDSDPFPRQAMHKIIGNEGAVIIFRVDGSIGVTEGRVLNGADDFAVGERAFSEVIDNVMGEDLRAGNTFYDHAALRQGSRRHARTMFKDDVHVKPGVSRVRIQWTSV